MARRPRPSRSRGRPTRPRTAATRAAARCARRCWPRTRARAPTSSRFARARPTSWRFRAPVRMLARWATWTSLDPWPFGGPSASPRTMSRRGIDEGAGRIRAAHRRWGRNRERADGLSNARPVARPFERDHRKYPVRHPVEQPRGTDLPGPERGYGQWVSGDSAERWRGDNHCCAAGSPEMTSRASSSTGAAASGSLAARSLARDSRAFRRPTAVPSARRGARSRGTVSRASRSTKEGR